MPSSTLKQTGMSIGLLSALSFSSAIESSSQYHAQARQRATDEANSRTVIDPADWRKVDAGPFSILAPPGWEFHQLPGVDSFVGEFLGRDIVLKFDYGEDSNPLKKEKKPAYTVIHKPIGGRRARIVSPIKAGHGITGVYIRDVGNSAGLTLWGQNLTSAQQDLALKIFETLRFGGPPPKYVLPPPPCLQR